MFNEQTKLCVVFDASSPHSETVNLPRELEDRLQLKFAPNADDWIVKTAELERHDTVIIVSADRALLDRAARHGAARMSPWQFAEFCTGALM